MYWLLSATACNSVTFLTLVSAVKLNVVAVISKDGKMKTSKDMHNLINLTYNILQELDYMITSITLTFQTHTISCP